MKSAVLVAALFTGSVLGRHVRETKESVNKVSLSDWALSGTLQHPVTQHYTVADMASHKYYVSGGVLSASSVSNAIMELELVSNSSSQVRMLSSTEEQYSSGSGKFQFTLSQWYATHQSAGFHDGVVYVMSPIYGGEHSHPYLLRCEVATLSCSITSLIHSGEEDTFHPCLTQKDNLLFVVGGKIFGEPISQVNVLDLERMKWVMDHPLARSGLPLGVVDGSCAVCGAHLYTFGGSAPGHGEHSKLVQQCSLKTARCKVMDSHLSLPFHSKYSRAQCIEKDDFPVGVLVAGGESESGVYEKRTSLVQITGNGRNQHISAVGLGPALEKGHMYFQLVPVSSETKPEVASHICTVGGQCLVASEAKVHDGVHCSKITMQLADDFYEETEEEEIVVVVVDSDDDDDNDDTADAQTADSEETEESETDNSEGDTNSSNKKNKKKDATAIWLPIVLSVVFVCGVAYYVRRNNNKHSADGTSMQVAWKQSDAAVVGNGQDTGEQIQRDDALNTNDSDFFAVHTEVMNSIADMQIKNEDVTAVAGDSDSGEHDEESESAEAGSSHVLS